MPTLGVCLGHQSMAQAFGGDVVRHEPVHGKTTEITHDGRSLFAGLPRQIDGGALPLARRRRASRCPTGSRSAPRAAASLMGIRHRELPAEGVQFHPESVLTPEGATMLRNFLGRGAT